MVQMYLQGQIQDVKREGVNSLILPYFLLNTPMKME